MMSSADSVGRLADGAETRPQALEPAARRLAALDPWDVAGLHAPFIPAPFVIQLDPGGSVTCIVM